MPLGQLADEIVRQSRGSDRTPVLVIPRYLSLRQPFFVHFIEAIASRCDGPVRIDWVCGTRAGLIGWATDTWARRQAAAVNWILQDRARRREDGGGMVDGSMELTASIGRPGVADGTLVVGICDDQTPLPAWTAAVRLTGWPTETSALQSSVSPHHHRIRSIATQI